MRKLRFATTLVALSFAIALPPLSAASPDELAGLWKAKKRFGPDVLPLAAMIPGYERNREAALVILEWLEARADVDPTLAAEIRRLAR